MINLLKFKIIKFLNFNKLLTNIVSEKNFYFFNTLKIKFLVLLY